MDTKNENLAKDQPVMQGDSRPPGKELLRQYIARLYSQAHAFEVLHNMLPEVPTFEQDQAIFGIVCNMKL